MGYCTEYNMHVAGIKDQSELDALNKVLEEKKILHYAFYCRYKTIRDHFKSIDGSTVVFYDSKEPVKWYDCEKDMTEIAAKFPDYIFVVTGNGDGEGDLWKMYSHGDKSCWCKGEVIYDKPSEEVGWPYSW